MRVTIPSCDCLMQVVQRVRRLFDLEAVAVHIGQHLSQDTRLAKMLAERPGLRVPGAWDGFEVAVRAVLGQELTVVGSPVLAQRLVQAFGRPVQNSVRGLAYLFPQPETLAKSDLTSIGVPTDQAATISSLAQAVLVGKISFDSREGLQDTLARLCALPGLSQSVASYIAMRSFGEPDAFPHEDRGLLQALAIHGACVSPQELVRIFERFKPWRAYAAMHFSAATQRVVDSRSHSENRPKIKKQRG